MKSPEDSIIRRRDIVDEILFTSSSIIDLLSQIEEFKDLDISISHSGDNIELKIGDSIYSVATDNATDIEVPSNIVSEVQDVNYDAYDSMSDDVSVTDDSEVVESGVLKEIVKTLLVGGMVRLTSNILKK